MDVASTTPRETPREIPRELTSEMLNSRAGAGKTTVEEYRAMSDAYLAYELEDMPVTDSCDVVRYVSLVLVFAQIKISVLQRVDSGYRRFHVLLIYVISLPPTIC